MMMTYNLIPRVMLLDLYAEPDPASDRPTLHNHVIVVQMQVRTTLGFLAGGRNQLELANRCVFDD